jgi:23S rRNA (uracil1939-C5)-methyltransferase
MLKSGQEIELAIEKPAAGGRMIARHEGQVVLVSGVIPGERVLARIERADRKVAFAAAARVMEPSADRRDPFPDPLCGGCVYSHIAYERQTALKAEILKDAFLRIGRIPLAATPPVAGSPERGYRMRARFHVQHGRPGFYREGTHVLCAPAPTGQLTDGAWEAVARSIERAVSAGMRPTSIAITENIAGDERALAIEVEDARALARAALDELYAPPHARGVTVRDLHGTQCVTGDPLVSDPMGAITGGQTGGTLSRGPDSFFQANRYLLPALVSAVTKAVPAGGAVLDLYAGVGLFSIALASSGRERITAVEGDRSSGADLRRNAAEFGGAVTSRFESVEDALRVNAPRTDTVIVDPPRTGVSAEALDALARGSAQRIVYVSCDPATMARDARKLLDAGFGIESLQAFDLFPNTPHVEALGVFVKPRQ